MNLGLGIDEVDRDLINIKLSETCGNHDIVHELNRACRTAGSLWPVNELRNHSLHRGHMLHKHVWQKITEDVNKGTSESTKPMVYFMNPRFEESLRKMKGLIRRISKKSGL
jgi:hypothetical protein